MVLRVQGPEVGGIRLRVRGEEIRLLQRDDKILLLRAEETQPLVEGIRLPVDATIPRQPDQETPTEPQT